MGLSPEDLPALKRLAADNRPMLPSQSAALKDIVSYIHLHGESYPNEPGGFLGVTYTENVDGKDDDTVNGVEIRHRILGFAYRALEEGDVVLRVEPPAVEFPADGLAPRRPRPLVVERRVSVEIHHTNDFADTIRQCSAGDTVVLEVLRRGRNFTFQSHSTPSRWGFPRTRSAPTASKTTASARPTAIGNRSSAASWTTPWPLTTTARSCRKGRGRVPPSFLSEAGDPRRGTNEHEEDVVGFRWLLIV